MKQQVIFSIFAEEEDKANARWRNFRDSFFQPVCEFLNKYSISPAFLSYMGLAMVLPFIYFFGFNPWLAFIFLVLNGLFDGLDGPLARFQKRASVKGALIDIMSDYLSFFVVFMTFQYFGLLSPFWSSIYLVNYAAMLALIIFCRGLRVKFFPVIRSKYYLYLIFLVWLITGQNYFDPLLVFFSIYMVVTNFFLFDRIKCSLS